MPAKEFENYEDKTLRRKVGDLEWARLFQRVYNIPADSVATLVPAKGTVLPSDQSGNGLLNPRIKDIQYAKQPDGGKQKVVLLLIQPVAYA